jgi:hypothetical protein
MAKYYLARLKLVGLLTISAPTCGEASELVLSKHLLIHCLCMPIESALKGSLELQKRAV